MDLHHLHDTSDLIGEAMASPKQSQIESYHKQVSLILTDNRQPSQDYSRSRIEIKERKNKNIESPVSKYKEQSSLERKSVFKFRDVVDQKPDISFH